MEMQPVDTTYSDSMPSAPLVEQKCRPTVVTRKKGKKKKTDDPKTNNRPISVFKSEDEKMIQKGFGEAVVRYINQNEMLGSTGFQACFTI